MIHDLETSVQRSKVCLTERYNTNVIIINSFCLAAELYCDSDS